MTDKLKLSRVPRGGVTNTAMKPWSPTWEEFCDELSKLKVGSKDGTYFVRGHCEGDRSDDNMGEVELIVLDLERSFDETGANRPYRHNGEELSDKWCPYTLDQVSAALSEHNLTHFGHTSFSHQELGEDYNRARIYLPLAREVRGNWKQALAWVMNMLHEGGIRISGVSEMESLSQPWYFPRLPEGRKSGFKTVQYDGNPVGQCKSPEQKQTPDLVLHALETRGWVREPTNNGGWRIHCPWTHEHTDEDDSGAAYWPPTEENNWKGGFKCHHDHCSNRSIKNLLAMLEVETEADPVPAIEELVFQPGEMEAAQLTSRCIVNNYIYADVGTLVGPGAIGKTTLALYEMICIALGRPLWGLEVEAPGLCVFVTAEDSREKCGARLLRIMKDMQLNPEEGEAVRRNVIIWDVRGKGLKLAATEKDIVVTELADQIVNKWRGHNIAVITIDPLVSFGANEEAVNSNAQALVTAGGAYLCRNGLLCSLHPPHRPGGCPKRVCGSVCRPRWIGTGRWVSYGYGPAELVRGIEAKTPGRRVAAQREHKPVHTHQG